MADSNQSPRLQTYLLFNRFLKFKKLKYKLFTLAFIATHVPLIAYIAYIFLSKQHNWTVTELVIILLATLIGTVFVLWSIHHLLKPLKFSTEALDYYLKDGTIMPLPHDINDEMGQLMRSIGYTLNSLDRRFNELENVSSYDFLTDLHNRRSAKVNLTKMNESMAQQQSPAHIAMIDIDNFKSINDEFGHFAGDVILKDLAEEIQSCFMTPDDWAARWGGDEFLLILYGTVQSVVQQLKTLQQNIQQKKVSLENQMANYTISIGTTSYEANQTIQETLKQADNALLTAKSNGKNQLNQY